MSAIAFRLILLATAFFVAESEAAVITYATTNVSGSTWRYDYIVANDGSITDEIYFFDILFDPALYDEESLTIVSDPGLTFSWDQIILASGIGVPAAFDALVGGGGVGIGENNSGFAVSFNWLGTGTPGVQGFAIFDPDTFDLLGEGTTTAIPAPASLLLMGTSLLTAGLRARRKRPA